ncbi:MAG: hypothetical protein J6U54_06390 [Clostridiales bacterium]|nr:hypothetical protein [Clostridiales bacterium]
MKRTLSLILISTLLFGMMTSVSGCGFFEKIKRDRYDRPETEGTEDEEEEEEGSVDFSLDDLKGVWFDEHGPVLKIDDVVTFVRDYRQFELLSVEEDKIVIKGIKDDNFSYSEFKYVPDEIALEIPLKMTSDGYIDLMGNKLFRDDTKDGKKAVEKINESMESDAYVVNYENMGLLSVYFVKDQMCYKYESYEYSVYFSNECGIINLVSDYSVTYDAYLFFFYNDVSDDDIYLVDFSGVYKNSEEATDSLDLIKEVLPDEFYCFDGNNIKLRDTRFDDGNIIIYDLDGNEEIEYELTDSAYDPGTMYFTGLSFNWEGTPHTDDFMEETEEYIFYMPWSLSRIVDEIAEGVRDGNSENTCLSNVMEFQSDYGKINVTVDIDGKDPSETWIWDYATVERNEFDYFSVFDEQTRLSEIVDIYPREKFTSAKIVFEIDKDYETDKIYIYHCPNGAFLESSDVILDFTSEVTSDALLITLDVTSGGKYCVCYGGGALYENTLFDVETLLASEPEETYWASMNETGDILDMVDLEYIENSIFDECGSACFWVSTPEELASAFYYVNAHEVLESDELKTMYYIHLLNDIDLEGFDFVPLGWHPYKTFDGEYVSCDFQGIIFGNGYSIKNFTRISDEDYYVNSFFGDSHMMTVIGLTLDHPKISQGAKYEDNQVFFYSACISEYFDCSYIVNPDVVDNYHFGDTNNDSVNLFDCTSYIGKNGDIKEHGLDDDYADFYYNGYDNWVRRYYQGDGTEYKYDAEKEYEEFQKDPVKFYDMSYYLGEEKEEYEGYLCFQGWLVGEEFCTNYGYVYYA